MRNIKVTVSDIREGKTKTQAKVKIDIFKSRKFYIEKFFFGKKQKQEKSHFFQVNAYPHAPEI